MDSFRQQFNYKTINDAIYGNFGLSELEVKLLDTKAMQRLRRVRQMGFSSYVFPCGEHSRFVHSLGVLCIMGKMCNVLYSKGHITKEEVINLRIAALLHDVGHYPFSHLTEVVYGYLEFKSTPVLLNPKQEEKSILSIMANQTKKKAFDHEHLGLEVIKKDPEIRTILDDAKIDAELIGKIVTGEIGIYKHSIVYTQLMHSSLDADRMDYLLRDSKQAGVVFGNIDLDYIINNMCKVKYKVDEKNEIYLIAVQDKAQSAVEHFLMARYFHYSRTIMHKSSMAFETVAKVLIYKMLMGSNSDLFYSNYQKLVDAIGKEEFYGFTDDFMWTHLKDYVHKSQDAYLSKLWNTLEGRKKPRIIVCYKDLIEKQKNVHSEKYILVNRFMENNQKEIAENFGINIDYIGHIKTSISIDSMPDYLRIENCKKDFAQEEALRDAIKIVNKDNQVSFLASDDTSLINKMVDFSSVSITIFVIDTEEKLDIVKMKDFINNKTE